MKDNIYTYITTLPPGINEMVAPCYDGYTIYIDARLNKESQMDAYNHAVWHIENTDFEKFDVQSIEYVAHMDGESA